MAEDDRDFIDRAESITDKLYGQPMSAMRSRMISRLRP